MRAAISNTRPPRPVLLGVLSFVVRTGAALCLLILYCAVAAQSGGVVRTHTVAFRTPVDFVCVLLPRQVQIHSCSVGVLIVLVASVQNA